MNTRRTLERLWTDRLDLWEYREDGQNPDGSVRFAEVPVAQGIRCKVSFGPVGQNPPAKEDEAVTNITQTTKLFLGNEHQINPNSKLVIARRTGHVLEYAMSGIPAIFSGHQEITLKSFEGYA